MNRRERSPVLPFRGLAETVRNRKLARARLAKLEWELRAAWWSARARSERTHWHAALAEGQNPHQLFGSDDDLHWFWLNSRGSRAELVLQSLLPGLPKEDVQQKFTGSGGETTLREAWNVYRLVKDAYRRYSSSGPLMASSSVLDYGCGWGRIIRFFLKDVDPANLLGIDCDGAALEICRKTNRWSNFVDVDPMPPSPLPGAHFDLIYAYSVFSHLSEEAHDRWLDEFQRILKPGGLLMVSTRPRSFIEKCVWLRSEAGAGAPASHKPAASAFSDPAAAFATYDGGGYCFSHRSDDDPPHFGETCIPRQYVVDRWTDRFRPLDFIDDHQLCEQNFIVVQRP